MNIWECRDKNGCLICDGGPSRIWNKGRDWEFYTDGIGYHRLDGPVISSGWWIHGNHVTYDIHQFAQENNIDLENLSDEDKVLIALHFS